MKKGYLVYTNAAGFGFQPPMEEMTLEEAKADVLTFFNNAAPVDVNDNTWWFYRDENAAERDENNADHNAGVVAVWTDKEGK